MSLLSVNYSNQISNWCHDVQL